MTEPQSFGYRSKTEALSRHTSCAREHATLAVELSAALYAEREAEQSTIQTNPGPATRVEQLVKVNTLERVREVWRIKGEMQALESEMADIRIQLAYGGLP